VVENAKARVCVANQRVLLGAVEIFTQENNAFPGSLSQLDSGQIENAWVKEMHGRDNWQLRFAYAIISFDQRGNVYANGPPPTTQPPWVENYVGDVAALHCPSDPLGVSISYGINSSITQAGQVTWQQYKALPATEVILGDCLNSAFASQAEIVPRHRYYRPTVVQAAVPYGLYITKDKRIHSTYPDVPPGVEKY
jgi:hypothetical protein